MREKTIAGKIRKNNGYLFLMYLLVSLLPLVILDVLSNFTENNYMNEQFKAESLLYESYSEIEFKEIEKHGGTVDIITDDFQSIHLCGKKLWTEGALSKEEYANIMLEIGNSDGADSDYQCDAAYSERGNYWVIVSFPNELRILFMIGMNLEGENTKYDIMMLCIAILGYLFLVFLVSFISAKITARQFTRPLKELSGYTKRLSQNKYDDRIQTVMEGEFKELKEEFDKLSDSLQLEREKREKLEMDRQKILMELSHDLKNPLASIQGYSEVLLESESLEEEKREQYYRVLYQNSVRANQLITDLFTYVRTENKRLTLQKKKVDFCEFITRQILLYQPEIEKAGMNLDFSLPQENNMILCNIDELQMERVFSNLIENAIKYNDAGTTIYVKAEEISEEGTWKVIIGDNGIGIPERLRDTIFEPFVRVDEARNSKTGGSGLGLAIVKNILAAHGFAIQLVPCSKNEANQNVNCGCQFLITLTAERK